MTNTHSKPAYDNNGRKLSDGPILPLIDEDDGMEIDDTRASTFKLRTAPADADSPKYSFKVAIVDSKSTPRQAIKWITRMEKVFAGLNMTNATAKHNLLLEMVNGTARSAYLTALGTHRVARHTELRNDAYNAVVRGAGESDDDFNQRCQDAYNGVGQPDINNDDIRAGQNGVMLSICPYKALEKQKRFMRRKMRKPADMTTRTYVNNLARINDEELRYLPPFNANQGLGADEVVDIICYGIPKSWMKRMDEFDFDPFTAALPDLIAFCERMESAEDFEKGPDTKQSASNNKKLSKKHKSNRNTSQKGDKWCAYHESTSHNTEDCEVLKKLKASKGSGSDNKPPYKNKTWKRKSDDAKSHSNKELSAIVEKAAKVAVSKAMKKINGKKECNAVNKRKVTDSDSSGDDSDGDNSLNMIDQKMADVDKELSEFNFDDESIDC